MSLLEILVAAGLVLLLGAAMILGIRDARRRSRDASRLSDVRVLQAEIERYRHRSGAYPADLAADAPEAALPEGTEYAPVPEGCGTASEILCRGYAVRFRLEGKIGGLAGGVCEARPEGITCTGPEK
jgi:type II secretory pathway pseudopilin PulG